MRAVIDTNVLLSGLLWRGHPLALLEHVRADTLAMGQLAGAARRTHRGDRAGLDSLTRLNLHRLSQVFLRGDVGGVAP